MTPKAVLFDLDGTLLNTLEDIGDSVNRVLARHGYPTHGVDAYRVFIGNGVEMLITRALPPHARDDVNVRLGLSEYRQDYSQNWDVKTRPYDGVPEMLDMLASRGLPMAILSNKPDESTKQCVAKLLPRWSFQVVMGALPNVPLKPDPSAALNVARQMGMSPADMLYLGDTSVDIKTALAAGMFPVGVLWGFRPAELGPNGAKALMSCPEDIRKLL